MKSIAFFNNKGGVGKTTLLCNLAAYLAKHHNKKILIIDADPQCNATQSVFDDEFIEELYENKKSFTIYSVVQPLSAGKGYTNEVKFLKSHSFGVDIIAGDPRLALTEDLLARDWSSAIAGELRGLRTTLLFTELLSRCQSYDFVLFDMGPSLGAINRSVLISSDFFLSPMSIDIFSIRAIENISISLENWQRLLSNGLSMNDDPDELPNSFHDWKIRFAGYVTQQYTAKIDAHGQRRAVHAYEKIMNKIPKVIKNNFVKKFQQNREDLDYLLGTIPNLHSLVPMSQNSRKPIFGLKSADGVVGAHFTKVKESAEIFRQIATRLEENVNTLS